MTYPKPFMSLADLAAFTGLSEEYLLSVYRRKDNDFAGKLDPAKKNSKIFFDTEKFDQWRAKQIKLEVEAMRRKDCGVGVKTEPRQKLVNQRKRADAWGAPTQVHM